MYAPKPLPFDLRRVSVDLLDKSGTPWTVLDFDVQGEIDPDDGLVVDSLTFSRCKATWFSPYYSNLEMSSNAFRKTFVDLTEVQEEITKLACREVGLEYQAFATN